MTHFSIHLETAADSDALEMVEELGQFHASLYPAESNHGLFVKMNVLIRIST